MGQPAGSLYRIKNNEQGHKYRAQSWLGSWGLADWIDCVAGFTRTQKLPEFLFADLVSQAGIAPSWAGKFISTQWMDIV